MTIKMPGVVWKPISRNYTKRKRSRTDCVILHIAVTEASSLKGWFNNPSAYASSHFYVRRDGTIEQYLGAEYISWANGAGNSRAITVETQGMGTGSWTGAQCKSLARICAWSHTKFGVRTTLMPNSRPSSKGIGYHRQGVNPWRVSGGELWSKSRGKICPGYDRIEQIPSIVANAAGGSYKPVANIEKKPVKNPKPVAGTKNKHLSKRQVKNVQRALAGHKIYRGAIDGIAGPVTEEAIEYYQRHQLFGGLVADGMWGPVTKAHYIWTKKLQSAMNKWKGYKIGVDGDYRSVTRGRVEDIMERNHGGAYKGVVDAIPGPVFCKMLGIPTHP
ncbi:MULTISPECIES: N-acetylmuramoyl-L-alanine amidase [unclassified Arthrobacter]|uniref:peptidoglycan recognition protein family protein n=1 Tax=unclassified Arthrobacter TaxID=235627 RepID=UPI0015E272DE|nr:MULTISPECIES: N-acetylmuramoyl-L-alanine amidase [unclassified Arthrobacter]